MFTSALQKDVREADPVYRADFNPHRGAQTSLCWLATLHIHKWKLIDNSNLFFFNGLMVRNGHR